MLNLVVFETEEELCELTGLTEEELWQKGLILMIGRLVLIELKLGEFEPQDKGQTELYPR